MPLNLAEKLYNGLGIRLSGRKCQHMVENFVVEEKQEKKIDVLRNAQNSENFWMHF